MAAAGNALLHLNPLPLVLLLLQQNFESFEIFDLSDSKSFYFYNTNKDI